MKIEISIRTVLITLAILAGLWVVGQILDIIYLLFISFLVMTALHPLVVFLERFRMPRFLGILLIYFIVFGLFGWVLVGAVPAFIVQFGNLISELPTFITRVLPYWNIDASAVSQQTQPIGESLVKVTLGVFSNIVAVVTVLVFTFYFLLERRHANEILTSVFGAEVARQALTVIRNIERRLGAWVRGQLLLMVVVGILSYIGLLILRVEFALPLALIAGLLEIVPMVGPIMSAVPAILVALATSPLLALSVVGLYVIVQQVENNILVPFIMKRSVGFAPLVTIILLMVGGRLSGVAGAVLSVPIALVVQEIANSVLLTTVAREVKQVTKNPSK